MSASASAVMARIDERVTALHDYVTHDVKPMVEKLATLAETTKWLKLGVIGIYSSVGLFVIQQVLSVVFK